MVTEEAAGVATVVNAAPYKCKLRVINYKRLRTVVSYVHCANLAVGDDSASEVSLDIPTKSAV